MEMPEFDVFANIQWTMRVGAPTWEQANELAREIVNKLLSDVRYQEISDESIDIEVTAR
jgi:hypothetical protein